MSLLKNLIDIPDQVRRGDFVLKLSEGVIDPEGTVTNYQATPALAECFDEALHLVKSAATSTAKTKPSKAAYLHGSFGSGKSHFMAVLHLLLEGNATARAIPELADVVSDHATWTEGMKFLMVPYHMLNATSLESRVLGGYTDYIRKVHPDAPTPAVYPAEGILANADQIREGSTDEKFFAKLNEGSGGASSEYDVYGDIAVGWNAEGYDRARHSPPDSKKCRELVSALIDTHLPATRNTGDFVDLDDGLVAITEHAQALGYDAVVLFLDELILWLASHAGDSAFLNREGNKIVKLVESGNAGRPIPLVSFIARQRDLRDLIGQHIAGAEKLAFADVLDHHEGRFGEIRLGDSNLPLIARKRILKPLTPEAEKQMDAEFTRTAADREEVMRILLTKEGKPEEFRDLYPFSPALVETLISVASLLQRERTALKVMAMLLAEQKETLKLGQIVPVGDLFDMVSQGDEAFTSDMKAHFDNANRLYQQQLKPLLEGTHNLSFNAADELAWDDPKRAALRNDDRLIKTLLLAALVPEVESLRNMTPERLAALNHGTIQTPIPGQEASTVLAKFRSWAASAGQIRITEGAGQTTLAIQLASVDTAQILEKANSVDNAGNRIRKLKELLFGELGRDEDDQLFYTHNFKWRGTEREAYILFANVWSLPTESLRSQGDSWRVIIDYPFDEEGHGVTDDIAKIGNYTAVEEPTKTICWLPSFFNVETLGDLGKLVRLDQILKENQFNGYVSHLSETEREAARLMLDSQRDQLRSQMISRLEIAYGIQTGGDQYLDSGNTLDPSDRVQSLDPSVVLKPPVASNIKDGLEGLLDQALRNQFPGHPELDANVSLTSAAIGRVCEVVTGGAQSDQPSVLVEGGPLRRSVRQMVVPLQLGLMGEDRFQIGQHWREHFAQKAAQDGGDLSVGKLRGWIDAPQPMGLPRGLQDLIILCYAAQTNRALQHHGASVEAGIGQLDGEMLLVEVSLPSSSEWGAARDRAQKLYGIPDLPLLNATNVSSLAGQVQEKATERLPAAQELSVALDTVQEQYFSGVPSTRLDTLKEGVALSRLLSTASGKDLIDKLASQDLTAASGALALALSQAKSLCSGLEGLQWGIFTGARDLSDQRRSDGQAIWNKLKDALGKDEQVVALLPKLTELSGRAVALLAQSQPASTGTSEINETNGLGATTCDTQPTTEDLAGSPSSQQAADLIALYGASQVEGDGIPEWLPEDRRTQLLQVHVFGSAPDRWSSMLVVTPLLRAVIAMDGGVEIDLTAGKLKLPSLGAELILSVKPEHLED